MNADILRARFVFAAAGGPKNHERPNPPSTVLAAATGSCGGNSIEFALDASCKVLKEANG